MDREYGKDVQITVPWARFIRLVKEGRIEKDELSQLRNIGRVLFTNDFVETPAFVRPRPKIKSKPTKKGENAGEAKVFFKPACGKHDNQAARGDRMESRDTPPPWARKQ